MRDLVPFLMFCGPQHGKAEEAVNLYCSIFPDSKVVAIRRYGPDDHGAEGTVQVASFELGGRPMKAIDNQAQHEFNFTPAISLWIDCTSAEELDGFASRLGDGGKELMPVGDYGFSARFGWIADRYGVTWQLNLPHDE